MSREEIERAISKVIEQEEVPDWGPKDKRKPLRPPPRIPRTRGGVPEWSPDVVEIAADYAREAYDREADVDSNGTIYTADAAVCSALDNFAQFNDLPVPSEMPRATRNFFYSMFWEVFSR